MPIVSIKETDKSIEIKAGEILYDALFDRGVELPHGCLSGSCGACRVEIIEGKDQLTPPGVIENNTIEALKREFTEKFGPAFVDRKEIRLSCRAKVNGNICFKPIR
jgi:ferredoxin